MAIPLDSVRFTPIHITRAVLILRFRQALDTVYVQVLAEDGNIYEIQLPTQSDRKHLQSMQSKIIGNYLLKWWGLMRTPLVSIHIPPSLWPKQNSYEKSKQLKPRWGKVLLGELVERTQISFTPFVDDPHYWSFRTISNASDLVKLALFDGWAGNMGRDKIDFDIQLWPDNKNRINLVSKNPLDLFGNIELQYLSKNYRNRAHFALLKTNLVQAVKRYNPSAVEENRLRDYFQKSNLKCADQFAFIKSIFPQNMALDSLLLDKIKDMLFNEERNQFVFSEFNQMLK